MEGNFPIPINNELILIERNDKKFKKRKKKEKTKKFSTLKIVFSLFLMLFIALSLMNKNEIKDSAKNIISSFKTETNYPLNTGVNVQIYDPVDKNISEKQDEFINTSPSKMTIINESAYPINYDNLKYTFPKKYELYHKFSNTSPIVLLISTSPKEAYSTISENHSSNNYQAEENNVSKIAELVCQKLNELGINALYLPNNYSDVSLYEGKEKYKENIEQILSNNPSISYIFDISREVSIDSSFTLYKETIKQNGINCPTINFTCGTNSKSLNEDSKMSICLMNKLSEFMNENSPLFVSKQTISKYDLYQGLKIPTIRVKIGSFACTYEEVLLSANLFASYLSIFLT